ncbi:hypothetical protein [Neobacillus sp. PS3-40]|uniref:hypothetical protein n=1 Tax=Neobacillus sp. PS3-40 TaxID=3070679 RepID=UPI0027E15F4B|nr:hypothetical protein [Neobacillus sp. PS3-40]WML44460.1 hypothetical protein RCG20_00660 [Neobacillus sp. PS3-40]
MKKLLVFTAALTFAIGLTACSANNSGTEKKTTTKETKTATDVKKPLVKFYTAFTNTINANDADLNAYEGAETPDPSLKAPASASAAAVANKIKATEIPTELNKQKADIQSALKDIADSYQMKADELKKATPSLDAANATFTKGVDELGKVFEDAKLFKPDLGKSVN